MSHQDHTTPFFMEDTDYPLPSSKRPSKNSQIYGVFYEESDPSDSETPHFHLTKPQAFTPAETDPMPTKLISNYPNFKKSNELLYEPTKKIQVKFLNKEKDLDKINEETNELNENGEFLQTDNSDSKDGQNMRQNLVIKSQKQELRAKRVFDFKKRKPLAADLSAYDLPEQLGSSQTTRKKVKLEESGSVQNQEAAKLKASYGKGFLMIRNLGFELGKGLGKDKQGIINPVEAVRKTAYNSNFENKMSEKLDKNEKTEDFQPEKSHKIVDETEKVEKRWKIGRKKASNKRKVDVKDLQNEWYDVGKKPVLNEKIIDMRGVETVYIEDLAQNQRKTGVLGEFLLILKSDYEGKKHKLHELIRKQRFGGDQLVNSKFEAEDLRETMKGLEEKKAFFGEMRGVMAKKETRIEEVIGVFLEMSNRFREKIIEYELYVYFLKVICEKAKLYCTMPFEDFGMAFLEFFEEIYRILEGLLGNKNEKKQDFFERTPEKSEIIEKCMVLTFENSMYPRIRSFLASNFDFFRNSDHFTEFLRQWKRFLPLNYMKKLFSQLIFPKMELEIREFVPFKMEGVDGEG